MTPKNNVTMSNVIVKVRKGSSLITPKFRQCLLHLIQQDVNSLKIRLELCDDGLILSENNAGNDVTHTLQHSVFCPFKELNSATELERDQDSVPVAVSIILESLDNHILLTRRSSHMRSSPNVWVPPGGHLDRGESLIECGLRELDEETGISLEIDQIQFKILCIWENVFPLILGFGEPKAHSLVVYYHVKCQRNHEELNKLIKINPEEVEAYTWLHPQAVAEIFQMQTKASHNGRQFTWDNGKTTETHLDYLKMFNRGVWISDKMFSGVQASLFTWYQNHLSLTNKL